MHKSTRSTLYALAIVGVIAVAAYYMYTQGTEGFQSVDKAKGYLATIAKEKPKYDALKRKRINSRTKKFSPADQTTFDGLQAQLNQIRGAADTEYTGIVKNIKNREARKVYMRTPVEKARLLELAEEKKLYEEVIAKLKDM
jgi:Tfp pilus assembly protein PilE